MSDNGRAIINKRRRTTDNIIDSVIDSAIVDGPGKNFMLFRICRNKLHTHIYIPRVISLS